MPSSVRSACLSTRFACLWVIGHLSEVVRRRLQLVAVNEQVLFGTENTRSKFSGCANDGHLYCISQLNLCIITDAVATAAVEFVSH